MRCAFSCALVLLSASGLHAQAADSAAISPAEHPSLRDGRWAIEFELPEFDYDDGRAGAVLGVWNMVSPRSALGADFGLSVSSRRSEEEADSITREAESTQVWLRFGPGIRRYFETRRDVAAYVELTLPLSAGGSFINTFGEQRAWNASLGVQAGLGLNWFITDALSLAGGFAAGFHYGRSEYEDPDFDRSRTDRQVSFGIQTGELRMGLWF